MSVTLPEDFEQIIRFHGHLCPGLAIGYRAAKIAAANLQADRSEDEELVAIVETDACGIDAFREFRANEQRMPSNDASRMKPAFHFCICRSIHVGAVPANFTASIAPGNNCRSAASISRPQSS
jgi:hypothetical protein